jgi:hypothetical protein
LGHLLALHVTPANEQDREQLEKLACAVQEATGESVELAYVGTRATQWRAAGREGREEARHQLRGGQAPRGRARICAFAEKVGSGARFRVGVPLPASLVKDYERLPETVGGLHFVAFACLFLHRVIAVIDPSIGPSP